MSTRSPDVAYRIDADAKLVWVGGGWEAFALENEAPTIADRSILGESLWRFVNGVETRHVYEMMFEKIRRDRTAVIVPFRCDSPDMRRYMELRIGLASSSGDELELVAVLLRTEPRPSAPLLEPRGSRSRELLGICSFCKRVEVMAADWVEVDEAVSRLELLAAANLPNLSHGVCPDCRSRVQELMTPGHPGQ